MKVMILEIPSFDSLREGIEGLVDSLKEKTSARTSPRLCGFEDSEIGKRWFGARPCPCPPVKPQPFFDCDCDFDCGCEDDGKIFGAGFEIDEPRCEDYDSRYEFESDHAAFDRFVEAGEDCVARGLEKTSSAPITKVKAFRKGLHEAPPIGVDLIGETHWWECL